MKVFSKASREALYACISEVHNFTSKAKWLVEVAHAIKDDKNIPPALEGLPGILLI